jgi:hypothetical protein
MGEIIVLDQPHQIEAYRLLVLRSAIKLEIRGGKRRGRPASQVVRLEFGYKGNKQKVLDQFEAHLREIGVLSE